LVCLAANMSLMTFTLLGPAHLVAVRSVWISQFGVWAGSAGDCAGASVEEEGAGH